MLRNSIINILLKTGLSLAFLYTALASIIVPETVISRWPLFISNRVGDGTIASFTCIVCFGVIVWMFFGNKKFPPVAASLICISLAGIFNILSVTFLFSLAPLFFISLALCIRYYPRVRVTGETLVTPLHEGHLYGEKNLDIVDVEKKEYSSSNAKDSKSPR